ncbi:glycosyltransferase family 2 protein [Methylomonas lenta]|nr:glycosyltransferase [Methylomonas lenta]
MNNSIRYPLISVIMPCYNAQAFLEISINSIFRQSYPNIELIIIDDGSTDRSPQILDEINKKSLSITVLRQNKCGPYPARNLALQHAQGEYVAFLDADDYWSPDCLEKLYYALIEANVDLSYCGWQNVIENGVNGPQYVPPAYESSDIIQSFLNGCPWPIHAALVRKSIIDKVQGFSTRSFSSMDYDFWLRIAAESQKIKLVPEVLAFYRWHNHGQISSIKWKQVLDAWQVKKDFIINYNNLVTHIPKEKLSELVDGYLITQAYTAFWKRDLISAQQLFRVVFISSIWHFKDLPYIAVSFLPYSLFSGLVNFFGKTDLK